MSRKQAAAPRKVGVIIANTGTPGGSHEKGREEVPLAVPHGSAHLPHAAPRVVDAAAHDHILRKRSRASAEKYQKIWTEEGSPLVAITASLERGLNDYYAEQGPARHGARRHELRESRSLKRGGEGAEGGGLHRACRFAHVPSVGVFHHRLGGRRCGQGRAAGPVQGRRAPCRRLRRGCHLRPGRGRLHPQRGLFRRVGRSAPVLVPFHSAEGHRGGGHLRAADRGHESWLWPASSGLDRRSWTISYQSRFDKGRTWLSPFTRPTLERLAQAAEPGSRLFMVCPNFAGRLPGDALRRALRVGAPLPCGDRRRRRWTPTRNRGPWRTQARPTARCDDAHADLADARQPPARCRPISARGAHRQLGSDDEAFIYVPCLNRSRAHLKVLTHILAPYVGDEA